MWTILYHFLRFLTPFHKVASIVVTVFLAIAAVAFLLTGNYVSVAFAFSLMFLLYMMRQNYPSLVAAARRKAESVTAQEQKPASEQEAE